MGFESGRVFFKPNLLGMMELLPKTILKSPKHGNSLLQYLFNLQDHYQLIGLYPQAFELNQAVLDKNVEENAISLRYFKMGAIFELFGQNDKALHFLNKVWLLQQIGDRQGEGATLNNISQIYDAKRRLRQRLALFGTKSGHSAANRRPSRRGQRL